jgi:hypothetical protein
VSLLVLHTEPIRKLTQLEKKSNARTRNLFFGETAMASQKKQRKTKRQGKKARLPRTGPFRHPDGDRRHRETMAKAVQEAMTMKKMRQQGALTVEEALAIQRMQQGKSLPHDDEEE